MANFRPKNHKHRGGDRLCIGGELRVKDHGKLVVEPGAAVEGLGVSADVNERLDRLTEEILNKGYQTEEQVRELVKSELGVIENGTY